MKEQAIRHTVVFRLVHPIGSTEERRFLEAGQTILSTIPGVQRFEVLKQISSKNGYAFGFSMEFADTHAYDDYNRHPHHVQFVNERWKPEVAEFLEIDYQVWSV